MGTVSHSTLSIEFLFEYFLPSFLPESVSARQKEVFISILMILRRVPGYNSLYVVRFS